MAREKPLPVILTGGTSGIGRALAERLAPHVPLIALCRNDSRGAALRDALPEVDVVACDLTDARSVAGAAAEIRAVGPLGGLINCAAVQYTAWFTEAEFEAATIRRELGVNLAAPAELIALLLPQLQAGGGYILNVNSGLGLVPKASSAVYSGSKGGLNILSQALRHQLAGTGVSVHQAFLPLVDTPMTAGRGAGKLAAGEAAERILAGLRRGEADIDVGKVKLLRQMNRWAPRIAARIMRRS